MEISVKTIKKMLGEEIERMYQDGRQQIRKVSLCDALLEMLYIGHEEILSKLEAAQTYEDLNDVISFAGYRMSLQQWLDSY